MEKYEIFPIYFIQKNPIHKFKSIFNQEFIYISVEMNDLFNIWLNNRSCSGKKLRWITLYPKQMISNIFKQFQQPQLPKQMGEDYTLSKMP